MATDKKTESAAKSPVKKDAQKKKLSRVEKWWNETLGELRRVTWPTKDDAIQMTKIVLVVVFAMAAFLGVVDFVFSELFRLIIS